MITFDFSKPRVRMNGKVLPKYLLAYYFDLVQPVLCWTIIYDVYNYADLACKFRNYLLANLQKCEIYLGDSLSIEN